MKKMLLTIIALLTVIIGTLAFVSCNVNVVRPDSDDKTASTETGASAAGQTEAKGILSAEVNENGELILKFTDGSSVNLGIVTGSKGDKGDKGEQGENGQNGKDGQNGQDGKSAYEIWLENGNSGSEADFLEWLKGQKGDKGDKGDPGSKGDKGNTGNKGDKGDQGEKGDKGDKGEQGEAGRGIASMEINDNGELIVTYTDGTSENLGVVGGQKRYIVKIYYVGDELWVDYSDGITEKISVESSSCNHENAVYVEQVAHKTNADGTFEKGIYLMLCPDCGLSKTVSEVRHTYENLASDPTCIDDGYIWLRCVVCGYETDKEKTADALGHNFVICPMFGSSEEIRSWCENGGWTIEMCDRCAFISENSFWLNAEDARGHHSKTWEVMSKPTWDTFGKLHGICFVCGSVVMKTIPPCSDEVYTVSDIDPWKASCGEVKTGTFTIEIDEQKIHIPNVKIPDSNHILKGEAIDLSANNGVLFFDNAAEFKASGITLFADEILSCGCDANCKFTCDACGYDVLVKVRLKHVRPEDAEPVERATCENSGKYVFECTACRNENAEEIIPALGHKYSYTVANESDGTYTVEITCDRAGCEYNETLTGVRSIEKTVEDPTCEKEGNIRYDIVDASGKLISLNQKIEKLAHTLKKTDGTTVSAPAKDVNDVFIKYNYADFKDDVTWFADTEFKCTNQNITGTYVCDVCGESVLLKFYVDHVPTEGEGEIISRANCTESALRAAFTCQECGEYVPETTVGEPLGHDKVFNEAVKTGSGKWVVFVTCKRDGCDYSGTLVFDEEPVKTTIVPATCSETGVWQCIGIIEGEKYIYTVEIEKTAHTTASGKKYYEGSLTYPAYDGDIRIFADLLPPCDSNPCIGCFTCAECENEILVKAKAWHTKPANIADENKKNPTCTQSGWIRYVCVKCDEQIDEIIDPSRHNLTAKVENGYVAVTCDTEGCELNITPYKKDLSSFHRNDFIIIDVKKPTCNSDGYNKYALTFVFTYDMEWTDVDYVFTKSETVNVEFDDLVVFENFRAYGHTKFVTEIDSEGNEVDKIFITEIEKEIDGINVVYIARFKKCADCGELILVEKPVPKPAEDEPA